jgi:hypothetical protein
LAVVIDYHDHRSVAVEHDVDGVIHSGRQWHRHQRRRSFGSGHMVPRRRATRVVH